jgi:hypothetical protein
VPAVPEPPHAAPADMVEHKIDQALDMTFPASDPPAWGFLHECALRLQTAQRCGAAGSGMRGLSFTARGQRHAFHHCRVTLQPVRHARRHRLGAQRVDALC